MCRGVQGSAQGQEMMPGTSVASRLAPQSQPQQQGGFTRQLNPHVPAFQSQVHQAAPAGGGVVAGTGASSASLEQRLTPAQPRAQPRFLDRISHRPPTAAKRAPRDTRMASTVTQVTQPTAQSSWPVQPQEDSGANLPHLRSSVASQRNARTGLVSNVGDSMFDSGSLQVTHDQTAKQGRDERFAKQGRSAQQNQKGAKGSGAQQEGNAQGTRGAQAKRSLEGKPAAAAAAPAAHKGRGQRKDGSPAGVAAANAPTEISQPPAKRQAASKAAVDTGSKSPELAKRGTASRRLALAPDVDVSQLQGLIERPKGAALPGGEVDAAPVASKPTPVAEIVADAAVVKRRQERFAEGETGNAPVASKAAPTPDIAADAAAAKRRQERFAAAPKEAPALKEAQAAKEVSPAAAQKRTNGSTNIADLGADLAPKRHKAARAASGTVRSFTIVTRIAQSA